MKNVLMLGYHFPPIGGVGALRTLKFSKYLRDFGWNPIIICAKESKFAPIDESLLSDVSDGIEVHRTKAIESKVIAWGPVTFGLDPKWTNIPDPHLGWYPFALREALGIAKKSDIDLIYATAPPYTSLLVARAVKEKIGRPLVVDFRDPWIGNFNVKYPTRLHQYCDRKLENKVIQASDRIIVSSESMGEKLLQLHPEIEREKVVTISNGYDPADFKNVESTRSGKFTMSHIGSFYGRQTPQYFVEALKKAIDDRPSLRMDAEVFFMGRSSKEYWETGKRYGLEDIIHEIGFSTHELAIERMRTSNALLLVIGEGEGAEGVLTGKVFEYLASNRPIIAMVPKDGAAAQLIRDTNSGKVVSTSDVDAIKRAIIDYFDLWKTGKLTYEGDLSSIEKYDRRNLTQRLAHVFEEAATK